MSNTPLVWDEEALKRLEKIPAFVRGMAKGKIEKEAQEAGETRITTEFMDKIKSKLMG
jgi:hypothetical protein